MGKMSLVTIILLFSISSITCKENNEWKFDKISFCKQSAIGSKEIKNLSASIILNDSLFYFELKSDSLNINKDISNPTYKKSEIDSLDKLTITSYCRIKIDKKYNIKNIYNFEILDKTGNDIIVFYSIKNYLIYINDGLIVYFKRYID